MKKEDCIFCKLANGEIPANVIYQDDDFTVFLDADPATRGHALIVPKEHYANLYELDDDIVAKVMPLAKKLATHMTGVLGCDGFNVVQNNNEVAGQTVFHFHVHLIPRYEGGSRILEWDHQTFTDEEMAQIRDALKM